MAEIPSIKVQNPKGGMMIINARDYDPVIHKMWSDVETSKPVASSSDSKASKSTAKKKS